MPIMSSAGSLSAGVAGVAATGFLYPLRNSATNPTGAVWQGNNPNAVFIPNVGLVLPAALTSAFAMFASSSTFNDADVSTWDVSTVTTMEAMFQSSGFNQPLNNWNTSNVTSMRDMFAGALAFNQDISSWNVNRVTTMQSMFQLGLAFNCGQTSGTAHNLMQRTSTAGWRVNNVTGMVGMFDGASAFNGNISNWCVTNISSVPNLFARNANANFTTARQPTWGQCPFP